MEKSTVEKFANELNLPIDLLLKQLESKTAISCKDVTFRFFGLSLATINSIFSLVFSVIFLKLFIGYENK